ncbi:MAG: endonuclease/exonuclease/phosphatase family protein, partial [Bacteroidota bacterium]
MSFFYHLEHNDAKEQRIAQRLLHLKAGLKAHGLPARNLDESLLLATWNIRDFDTDAYGRRDREALSYMAEIISHFDLVAVQEVKRDLRAFNRLMELLGGWWKCILTDTTEGTQGNEERMAFIFDSRKLRFGGLAGEVVVPPVEDSRGRMLEPSKQLYRTPFIAGFKAGWFNFMICTAHIMYGKSTANDLQREAEIRALAQLLARRTEGEHAWSKNLILLGDFNIFKPSDVTFDAITDAGFFIPEKLQSLPSNAIKNKHYDQIAFLAPDLENHIAQSKAG